MANPFDIFQSMLPKMGALDGTKEAAAEDILTTWGAEDQEPLWDTPEKFKPEAIGSRPSEQSPAMPGEPVGLETEAFQAAEGGLGMPDQGTVYDEETLREMLQQKDVEQAANDEIYQIKGMLGSQR